MSDHQPVKTKLLQLKSGGGILLLTVVLVWVIIVWRMLAILPSLQSGNNLPPQPFHGFDLSTTAIPTAQILTTGMPKDGLPLLNHPATITAGEADRINREKRGKYLVSTDTVIGVVLNGQARAYPIRVLNWHEIINDTLGETPILVSYNPLCDSAVVYDRRLENETAVFGLSGLLYNSNPLLYDNLHHSLWQQVTGKAVSGTGLTHQQALRVIPASVVSWAFWRTRHPETTVIFPPPEYAKRYKRTYGNYFGSDLLRFPVDPLPPKDGLPKKTPIVVLTVNGVELACTYDYVARQADGSGVWRTEIGGEAFTFHYLENPPAVYVKPVEDSVAYTLRHCARFAWYAMNPGFELLR
jgi:hypothetical protein